MPAPRTARQFDVLVNPAPRARRQFPFLVVLQSDFAETGEERVVAPLAPRAGIAPLAGKPVPIVEIDGRQLGIIVPLLTTAGAWSLRDPIADVDHARSDIVAALDYLFLGF
jgi:toxin CcdB